MMEQRGAGMDAIRAEPRTYRINKLQLDVA